MPTLGRISRDLGEWDRHRANQEGLPEYLYAEPLVSRHGPVEVDVATLEESTSPGSNGRRQPTGAEKFIAILTLPNPLW